MNKQTQEALKMAIEQAIIEFEVLSSFPQYDLDYVDMIKELRGCLEALEQPKLTDEKGRPMTYWGGLEQPAQEPVAHIKQGMDGYPKLVFNGTFQYDSIAAKQPDIALYIKEQL